METSVSSPPHECTKTEVETQGLDVMIPSIDTERAFTLFSKLPPELRTKIWKHALPGARVIQYCLGNVYNLEIGKRWCFANSLIGIKTVCREARQVVLRTYEKVTVPDKLNSGKTNDEIPFVYIDYNKDIIYIERHRGAKAQRHAPFLAKIQHMAWREIELEYSCQQWGDLRSFCPELKTLTSVGTHDLRAHRHDLEWMLLYLPMEVQTISSGWTWKDNWEATVEAGCKYGGLATLCVEANGVLHDCNAFVNEHKEWEDVFIRFAVIARRKGQRPWAVMYLTGHTFGDFDMDDDSSIQEDTDEKTLRHWHHEVVDVGDGNLISCRSLTEGLPNRHPCGECGEQRWPDSKDAFCLHKVNGKDALAEET